MEDNGMIISVEVEWSLPLSLTPRRSLSYADSSTGYLRPWIVGIRKRPKSTTQLMLKTTAKAQRTYQKMGCSQPSKDMEDAKDLEDVGKYRGIVCVTCDSVKGHGDFMTSVQYICRHYHLIKSIPIFEMATVKLSAFASRKLLSIVKSLRVKRTETS